MGFNLSKEMAQPPPPWNVSGRPVTIDNWRVVEPAPLPWIYRDPQRWLLPMLAIVGLIIAAIAVNGL